MQRCTAAGQRGVEALVHELGTEAEFLLVPGDGVREIIDQQLRGNEFDARQGSFLLFMISPTQRLRLLIEARKKGSQIVLDAVRGS